MSLLLQALQRAARNRQGSGPEPSAGDGAQLELEPREPGEISAPIREYGAAAADPSALGRRTVSPAAASVLAAADPIEPTLMDHFRDRPVAAFGLMALLFAVFYGLYLYIQISHPLWLRGQFSTPTIVATSPPPLPAGTSIPLPSAPNPAPAPAASSSFPATIPATSLPSQDTAGSAAPTSELASLMNLPPKTETPSKSENGVPPAAKPSSPASHLDKLSQELATPKTRPERSDETPVPPRVIQPVRTAPKPTPPAPIAKAPPKSSLTGPKRLSQSGTPVVELNDQVIVNAAPGTPLPAGPTTADAYKAWKSGKLDLAKSIYLDVLENDPKNSDALLGIAGIAQQQGDSQEALNYFGRVLEVDPRNSSAQAGIIAITGQSDPAASETRLKVLLSREPSGFLHFSLGNLYARQNQWKPAQQSYFQAYQMDAENSDYAYNLAVSLEHIGQGKLAITYYRKALDLSLKQGRATFNQEQVIDRIAKLSLRPN